METRNARIVVETSKHRIEGEVTLPREGYRSRLSDFLNRGELHFLPMVDVQIEAMNGAGAPNGFPVEREFVAVATRDIVLAYPAEGTAE